MTKLTAFLTSVFLISVVYAQPTFTWSPAHTKSAGNVQVQLFGNETGYYIVNKKPPSGMEFSPKITIEYFTNNDRVFSKDVTPTSAEDFVSVVYFNKSLYILSALYNKEAGKNILHAKAVQPDGNIADAVEVGMIPASKLSARGRFEAAASPDGTKLIVLAQPDYTKDQHEKINIALYSNGFTKSWSTEQTYPYVWTKAVDNQPYVNNQGTAFILKRTDMKGNDNTYSTFSFNGKELKEHKISMDGNKKTASIVQAFSNEGDFAVGGYFTEDGKIRAGIGKALQGSFLQKISASGNDQQFLVIHPFEKRKDIIAKSIVFHADKTILLGERYYVSDQAAPRDASKPMTNEQMFARDYTYYGRDIIIDGFDASGKHIYYTSVEKDNTSKNDGGSWVSYFAAVINNQIVIIFNDDKYKYDDKKKILVVGGNKVVVAGLIDPQTGTVTKVQPVAETGPVGGKKGDMLLRPDVYLKLNETTYIIRAENPSIYRMGKVGF